MNKFFTCSTFILILFIDRTYCQTASNTVALNEKNLYYQALTQYLHFEKWDRGVSIDTLYIEEDPRITDSLLTHSGETTVIKLKPGEVAIHSKNKKNLLLYKVYPLRFENGEFSVSFVPFLLADEKKKRNANGAASVSYRVVYRFDNNKFVFQRVEDHGI
jgi:hypothetical protein